MNFVLGGGSTIAEKHSVISKAEVFGTEAPL